MMSLSVSYGILDNLLELHFLMFRNIQFACMKILAKKVKYLRVGNSDGDDYVSYTGRLLEFAAYLWDKEIWR